MYKSILCFTIFAFLSIPSSGNATSCAPIGFLANEVAHQFVGIGHIVGYTPVKDDQAPVFRIQLREIWKASAKSAQPDGIIDVAQIIWHYQDDKQFPVGSDIVFAVDKNESGYYVELCREPFLKIKQDSSGHEIAVGQIRGQSERLQQTALSESRKWVDAVVLAPDQHVKIAWPPIDRVHQ